MSAPALAYLLASDSHEARFRREIDDHYHLQVVASNSQQLIEYQAHAYGAVAGAVAEAAAQNADAMRELAQEQAAVVSMLDAVQGSLDGLRDTISSGVRATISAIHLQTSMIQASLERTAALVLEMQRSLRSIGDALRRPYEIKALELLNEAEDAMTRGMKTVGRDRSEEYRDAYRLLMCVLDKEPSRNYLYKL